MAWGFSSLQIQTNSEEDFMHRYTPLLVQALCVSTRIMMHILCVYVCNAVIVKHS